MNEKPQDVYIRAKVKGMVIGDRCAEVLASIVLFQAIQQAEGSDTTYPPTIAEMMRMNDFTSYAPIQKYLQDLQRHGVLAWSPGIPRSIRILVPVELEVTQAPRVTRQEKLYRIRMRRRVEQRKEALCLN